MSDKSLTKFGIIIPVINQEDINENQIIRKAIIAINNSEDWFGHYYDNWEDTETDPVVELRSEKGQGQTEDLLIKTKAAKADLLQRLFEIVEEEGVEEAATNYDVFNTARQIGAWRQPSGFLIDGTNWSFGEPILNESRLTEIKKHYDDEPTTLFLVRLDAQY